MARYVLFTLIPLLCLSAVEAHSQTCAQVPHFAKRMGARMPAFSSGDRDRTGVVLHDGAMTYQHPSWQAAGSVGPLVVTERGDVLFAPVPTVNTWTNPPEEQNTIFKIDSTSGIAERWLTLPNSRSPHEHNPFGIVGMHYDCTTKRLFVSSISGSTQDHQTGAIYAINVSTLQVVGMLTGEDYLGLAVVRANPTTSASSEAVLLLAGLARSAAIVEIQLDIGADTVRFGTPHEVHQFADGGYIRARKITPMQGFAVAVQLTEFRYMLLGQTEIRLPQLRLQRTPEKLWKELARLVPELEPQLVTIQ